MPTITPIQHKQAWPAYSRYNSVVTIQGNFLANGTIISGKGFSVTKVSTGLFQIALTEDYPAPGFDDGIQFMQGHVHSVTYPPVATNARLLNFIVNDDFGDFAIKCYDTTNTLNDPPGGIFFSVTLTNTLNTAGDD